MLRLCSLIWILVTTCPAVVGEVAAVPRAQSESEAGSPGDRVSPESVPRPTALRLPVSIRPIRYEVRLRLSPADEEFSGFVRIELDLKEAVQSIWLHGEELDIRAARLEVGGEEVAVEAKVAGDQRIAFSTPRPVGPGRSILEVDYSGHVSDRELSGIFRQKEGNRPYLFTQFEPIHARKAMPCFDEPSFKVPWQLTLEVPQGQTALSNTPAESVSDGADGIRVVRFAPTPPMPAYLVAFAVGEFDIVEARSAGERKVPVRIVVPSGHAARTSFAQAATPELLAHAERYFATPYPYEKLDLVAVPQFFGAMENPGLITFSQTLLSVRPEEETLDRQRRFAVVAAHELAHQWFGNLVTMEWWDDIWLNESFATWMERKIISSWNPSWGSEAAGPDGRARAMEQDRLASARRIRQPIESPDDLANLFDSISYAKGSTVLEMFERWIGEEPYREGVRRYLERHAWGTATAADFLEALSAGTGRGVTPAIETFLNQGGFPIVSFELVCAEGLAPRLLLSQKRYRPLGSSVAVGTMWRVPVCVRYGAGETQGRQCWTLDEPAIEARLDYVRVCPDWIVPNDGGAGYYRARLSPDQARALLRREDGDLTETERSALLDDWIALAASGDFPIADLLELLPEVVRMGDRRTVQRAAEFVTEVGGRMVPREGRASWQRFVRRTFGPRARALGFQPRPGEPLGDRLLRPLLIQLVAVEGADEALATQAKSLAGRWIKGDREVDPSMVEAVLVIAAEHGGGRLFERLRARLSREAERAERGRIISAMASFGHPRLIRRWLSIVASGRYDGRETIMRTIAAAEDPGRAEVVFDFLKENYRTLAKQVPRHSEARLASIGSGFCDPARRREVAEFFERTAARAPGGRRIISQILEEIDLCIAQKQAHQPSLGAFLK